MDESQAQAMLKRGHAALVSAQLAEAQACCEGVLAAFPRSKEALRLYGLLMQEAGRPAEAETLFKYALAIDDHYLEAWVDLGMLARHLGAFDAAISCFERACNLCPGKASYHQLLGDLCVPRGLYGKAQEHYVSALRLNPENPDLHNNFGILLQLQRRFKEAEEHYRASLRLRPAHPETLANLGDVLGKLKRWTEAEAILREALRLDPLRVNTLNNLFVVLLFSDQHQEAQSCVEAALRLAPEDYNALLNLGGLLFQQRKVAEALEVFRRLERRAPSDHLVRYNLGTIALHQQDFDHGWTYFEARLEHKDESSRRFHAASRLRPGMPVKGRRILIYAEQGLGDSIHFLRYARVLQAMGASVYAEVQKALMPLMPSVEGLSGWCAQGEPLPAFDHDCPLMSLPYFLGGGRASLVGPSAAWQPPAEDRHAWSGRLPRNGRPLVGLVWAGNPGQANDHRRSVPLQVFSRLFELSCDFDFVLLQKDKRAGDETILNKYPKIYDITGSLGSFGDTAAVIEQLDLVITVDTSVAHLAGSMGKPTWVLLTWLPCWRWRVSGDSSEWYPGMRLWRQSKPGDWNGLMQRVCESLGHWQPGAAPSSNDL